MMEREQPTPDELLHLKDSIVSLFQQLPPEHQATLGLMITRGILQSDIEAWFRETLRLTDTNPPCDFGLTQRVQSCSRVSYDRFVAFLTALNIRSSQVSGCLRAIERVSTLSLYWLCLGERVFLCQNMICAPPYLSCARSVCFPPIIAFWGGWRRSCFS